MLANAEPWSPEGDLRRLQATRFTDVRRLTRTGSTNADLLAAAREGASGPLVLVTDHQTAGRGRQDRTWFDQPGDSLLVSVLVNAERGWADLVPLATGVAAVRAVDSQLGGGGGGVGEEPTATALKWPNDVLVPELGERKLAGILVESTTAGGHGPLAVVIGMGLNLRWSSPPPPEVSARAATLEELVPSRRGTSAPDDSRRSLLVAYLTELDRTLSTLGGPGGRSATITDYRNRCLTVGRSIVLDTPAGTTSGRAVAIGDSGELLVEGDDGTVRTITAGDAHHRRHG